MIPLHGCGTESRRAEDSQTVKGRGRELKAGRWAPEPEPFPLGPCPEKGTLPGRSRAWGNKTRGKEGGGHSSAAALCAQLGEGSEAGLRGLQSWVLVLASPLTAQMGLLKPHS